MPETKLTDAELVILSLIYERPQHGYEVEQEITRRNMRVWTDLSTSSIYYVLQRLEKKGFIDKSTLQRGQTETRPRKVYEITPAGEKAWKAATLQALSQPSITYTNFLLGLHNLWNIPPGEALEAVKQYREWLEKDLQRQKEELETLQDLGVSLFPVDVLFEHGFVLGDAELSFLDDLINRLQEMAGES